MAVEYVFVGMSFMFAIGFISMLIAWLAAEWPNNITFHMISMIMFFVLGQMFLMQSAESEVMIVFNLGFFFLGVLEFVAVVLEAVRGFNEWRGGQRGRRRDRDNL